MMDNFKELVIKNGREGKVVFMTLEGPMGAEIDKFIDQPTEGLLYDLNRDAATVLSFIPDPKWVNDYAVMLVISRLKARLEEAVSRP